MHLFHFIGLFLMSHHAHVEQYSVCQHNQYLHKCKVTYMNCQHNVFSFLAASTI